MHREAKTSRLEQLKVSGFDDFFVGSSGQRMIDLEVNELRDHSNGTIGKDELSAGRVVAAEVLEVANGAVGDMVGSSHDSCRRFVRIVDHAVPNRTSQATVSLADHQGLAEPIEDVPETMAAVPVEQAIAFVEVFMDIEGAVDSDVIGFGNREQVIRSEVDIHARFVIMFMFMFVVVVVVRIMIMIIVPGTPISGAI